MKVITLKPGNEKFAYYSIRERIAFVQLAKSQGWKVTNMSETSSFDGWDVIYTDQNGIRNVGEIKIRKKHSDFMGGDKWIFERRKYDALHMVAKSPIVEKFELQSKFILVLFDKVLIFDVNEINENKWFIEELRAESVGGNTNTRDKLITHLNGQNGVTIDFQLDYDKLKLQAIDAFQLEYPNNNLTLNEYD